MDRIDASYGPVLSETSATGKQPHDFAQTGHNSCIRTARHYTRFMCTIPRGILCCIVLITWNLLKCSNPSAMRCPRISSAVLCFFKRNVFFHNYFICCNNPIRSYQDVEKLTAILAVLFVLRTPQIISFDLFLYRQKESILHLLIAFTNYDKSNFQFTNQRF